MWLINKIFGRKPSKPKSKPTKPAPVNRPTAEFKDGKMTTVDYGQEIPSPWLKR